MSKNNEFVELPLSKAFHLIEPGPVVLLSTNRKGKNNVMPMSFHMMLDFNPPIIACCLGDGDFSYQTLLKTKECVLGIPCAEMIKTVVDLGNCSGENTDKFKKFNIHAIKGDKVSAPLIKECFANIECKVIDTSMKDKYGLIILKGVKSWIKPGKKNCKMIHHHGNGIFVIDGKTINLQKRMTRWKEFIETTY